MIFSNLKLVFRSTQTLSTISTALRIE